MKRIFLLLLVSLNGAVYAQSQALEQLVYKIRDPQTNAADFRASLEKIGEYLAMDVQEELSTTDQSVETLTGAIATHPLVDEQPVLITILRAGLPLNAGVQKIFPNSKVGFLAMSRDEETLKAKTDYLALPEIEGKTVIFVDTMLATGGSLQDAIQIIEKHRPKKMYIIAAIASRPGIARILKQCPSISIFAAATDPFLNSKGYIVPGLGDAGDRSYGLKHIISQD